MSKICNWYKQDICNCFCDGLNVNCKNYSDDVYAITLKDCENCIHFYECDNMGLYEECLPDMKYYEESKNI